MLQGKFMASLLLRVFLYYALRFHSLGRCNAYST